MYFTTIFISVIIFGIASIFAVYLIVLFITSKGFKISPTVTSDSKSIKKIIEIIKNYNKKYCKEQNLKILDIGSGYGTMLFKMNKALNNPKTIFIGYEISKFSYKISKLRNKFKNIYLINDDINNLCDFDFDFVITFILAKQQKLFLNIYREFPKGTFIIANSLPIPFEKKDDFELIEIIKVHFNWDIYIYRKI
jgi:SAM-dependent methyltransferase